MKGIFWVSLSVALLAIAASVCYFLLAYVPARDRLKNQQFEEAARIESADKHETGCSAQANRATEQFDRELAVLNINHEAVTDSPNHYNEKLQQCFVEIQTFAKTGAETQYLMNAYENKLVQSCSYDPLSKAKSKRTCLDSENKEIDANEADERARLLMTQ